MARLEQLKGPFYLFVNNASSSLKTNIKEFHIKENLMLRWLLLMFVFFCLPGCSENEKSIGVDIQPKPVDLVLMGGLLYYRW